MSEAERFDKKVQGLVSALPGEAGVVVDAATAYARFRAYADLREARFTWKPPAWGAIAAICFVLLLFSFGPTRILGQKILQMLRVQKVAVVPVDFAALSADGHHPGKIFAQMISDNVVVTLNPGKPQTVASVEDASRTAGFTVRTPADLGAPQLVEVQGEGAFHMTLSREKMQDVLDQAGRTDIQIPESADGGTVAVHLPKTVHITYSNCRQHPANCMDLLQVPSPTVSVPPTLNISALAEAGLQVAGLSAAEAHAFSSSVDWSNTLVIPIPQSGSSYRTLLVDGVEGTLVETAARGKMQSRYSLIWIKGGMVYVLAGQGAPERAVSAAQSLN